MLQQLNRLFHILAHFETNWQFFLIILKFELFQKLHIVKLNILYCTISKIFIIKIPIKCQIGKHEALLSGLISLLLSSHTSFLLAPKVLHFFLPKIFECGVSGEVPYSHFHILFHPWSQSYSSLIGLPVQVSGQVSLLAVLIKLCSFPSELLYQF